MIKIESVETYGWEAAIRGMRNPMNSWDKGDSVFTANGPVLGPNDLKLAKKLCAGGSVNAKFRRMIAVTMDVTAPLYWWKEADTYKVGTVRNSCSTMHKIHAKPFERSDFSHDHLNQCNYDWLDQTIELLNFERDKFNMSEGRDKAAWWQMIQMLPESYNQRATLSMNYEVLRNIYVWRHDHKLSEWHDFCDMIEKLPYAHDLIL